MAYRLQGDHGMRIATLDRFVVATRIAEADTIVFEEVPHCSVPHQTGCSACLSQNASVACDACGCCYCSERCRAAAAEVHAAECAGVEAFNQVKDHENTGCLALRMLAKRWVQGVPTDGKAHWCHVQSAQDHSARVASLPSKLSANMEADGHLLFN